MGREKRLNLIYPLPLKKDSKFASQTTQKKNLAKEGLIYLYVLGPNSGMVRLKKPLYEGVYDMFGLK